MFHANMDTIKDRNGMSPTEQKILRIGGNNTQKNYTKQTFKTQITTITHLEPDILEWEVKWALGSITRNKASRGDGIPIELSQMML